MSAHPSGPSGHASDHGLPASAPVVTVLFPCLNEAKTLPACIARAHAALRDAGVPGEVLVSDNGSSDGSRAIALEHGARVVPAPTRGYGGALLAGIADARGRYILMLDADGSYDPNALVTMLPHLQRGADIVQGCRLPAGGGTVLPGAMPFLHRWLGNPVLTWMTRLCAGVPVHDVNCGIRAFRTDAVRRLPVDETGMPFAIEMLIRAQQYGLRIVEVPVVLAPDLRGRRPHLQTWRDGWRRLCTIVRVSATRREARR